MMIDSFVIWMAKSEQNELLRIWGVQREYKENKQTKKPQQKQKNKPPVCLICSQNFHLFVYFFFFSTKPVSYGSSQARGQIQGYSYRTTIQPWQCQIQAAYVTYTAAHSNTRSLSYWAGPGMEPAFSWIIVRCFFSAEPQQELQYSHFWYFQLPNM